MASSPLRAPAGQSQSRLLEMQKKFQQRHLATVAAVKRVSPTSSTTVVHNVVDGVQPVPAVRRLGVSPQQPQRRSGVAGPIAAADGDPVVQVDVKGKQQQTMRPVGRTSTTITAAIATAGKTATVARKPPAAAAVNGNGARKHVVENKLLLPPVVQPTVINALAAGESAAAAVASVSAAVAAGAQRPVVRAARFPAAATQQQRKPVAPARRRPPAATSPPAKAAPAAAARRTSPPKKQLSDDRGPPAKGMARCPLCARDFAADRLPKHEEVCRRSREHDRKRKVFDASRKRLEAVAAEAGVDVVSFKKKSQQEDRRAAEKLQKKKDAWRRKHDALVRNVRAARAVQRHLAAGGTMRDLPPELDNAGSPGPDDQADSDLVKCPHCGRTFNEASADRHIPLCADRQRNAAARSLNRKR